MLKKKLFNFRPLFIVFISMLLGIVLSRYILMSNYVYLGIFIIILFSSLILCILKKKIKQFLVFLLAFILGFLCYLVEIKTYDVKTYNDYVSVTARVTNISKTNSKYQLVVLDDVYIKNEKQNFNILLYNFVPNNQFSAGVIFEGEMKLSKYKAFNDNYFNGSNYRNNIKYVANAKLDDVKIIGNNLNFNEELQNSVKHQLDKFMTEENSAIAYAMLFGDKSEISAQTKLDFSESGISHILAVSGLHVGVLVGVILWIFKKLKVKNYISFIVITLLLVIYCNLCSFSPSVVRASIMSITLIASSLTGNRYDSLNSIGLAGFIILLISPLSVFDVGFQMSFACVIGIAIFAPTIKKLLLKIKFPNWLATALAMSVATQITLAPILINCFNRVSIISIIYNVFVVQMFSFAFVVLLIFLPLTYITSFFGNFLFFTQLVLEAIKTSANFVANIPYTFFTLFGLNFAFYLGYYTILFCGSRMMLINKKYKTISVLVLILLTFLACGIIYIA